MRVRHLGDPSLIPHFKPTVSYSYSANSTQDHSWSKLVGDHGRKRPSGPFCTDGHTRPKPLGNSPGLPSALPHLATMTTDRAEQPPSPTCKQTNTSKQHQPNQQTSPSGTSRANADANHTRVAGIECTKSLGGYVVHRARGCCINPQHLDQSQRLEAPPPPPNHHHHSSQKRSANPLGMVLHDAHTVRQHFAVFGDFYSVKKPCQKTTMVNVPRARGWFLGAPRGFLRILGGFQVVVVTSR